MRYGNLEDLFLHKAIYLQWNCQKLEFFLGGGGWGGGVSLLYFAFLFLFKLNLLEIFKV